MQEHDIAGKTQTTRAGAGRASDRTGLAILTMIVAVAMLVLMSTCVKLVGPDYHVFQVVFLRNVVAMLVMTPFVFYDGGVGALKTRRPFLQLTRSVSGLTGVCCFFYAVQHIPIADVTVISQAVPLFVTALAVPLLKERVGWRRWSAVAVGFAGVIMALGPIDRISAAALVAVCGTMIWSVTILTVRTLGATDSPATTTFYYMVFGTVAAGIIQPWFWQPVTMPMLLFCVGAGCFGALAQLMIAFALKFGEASVVTPFNYTGIIWGIVVDLVVWSVWPQWWTLGGAAVITAAGIYIFRREAARKALAG